MRKYETEFEFKVLKSFLDGDGGAKLPARQWSVPEEEIRTWVSHYSLHGIDGLRPKRSKYSAQFKLQVLSNQDREQLSSRQVAAVYDIRKPNQVVTSRRKLDEGGVEAFGIWEQEHSSMKNEQRSPVPPSATITDSAQALREGNKRFRAEVVYLKNSQALIRSKISAASTRRV